MEPFLGGAAVFLAADTGTHGTLNDSNIDLIHTYAAIREDPREIAARLAALGNDETTYYEVRTRFRDLDATRHPLERAVDFLYLNHHSYNGIYRVNRFGQYNVPFGARRRAAVPNATHLVQIAERLQFATLTAGDFQSALDTAGENDFVFADPPYTVAHNENGFVEYNQHLFTFEDQRRLATRVIAAADRGATVVVTNANHASIRDLYPELRKIPVRTKSTVGGVNASRAASSELVITNIEGDFLA